MALSPKLSSTKTIWPVMQAWRFSVCRTFLFSTHNVPVNDFYFQGLSTKPGSDCLDRTLYRIGADGTCIFAFGSEE